jgi:uncharacterized protein YodC (DUF2158 family)
MQPGRPGAALAVDTGEPEWSAYSGALGRKFLRLDQCLKSEQAPPFVLILHCDMIRIVKVDRHPSQGDSMNAHFRTGDVVRHKSGGKDITIIRIEDESVSGVTKKVAFCGWFEGQNFHEETIPVEMLEFVNRWFVAGG